MCLVVPSGIMYVIRKLMFNERGKSDTKSEFGYLSGKFKLKCKIAFGNTNGRSDMNQILSLL